MQVALPSNLVSAWVGKHNQRLYWQEIINRCPVLPIGCEHLIYTNLSNEQILVQEYVPSIKFTELGEEIT